MNKAIVPFQQDMSLADTIQLGDILVKSGFFQDSKQAAQAVVKVLAGRELGFGPIASMTGIYIVQGRITISASLMAAAIKRGGKYNYRIVRHASDGCEIEFFENGQSVGISTFEKEDAQRIGLLDKDNWKKYPANMYFARALSNGAKWFCPDIFSAVYMPEELGAEVDAEGEVIESTLLPAEPDEPEQREPVSREAIQNPTFISWPELKKAAVERLGYKHTRHVENTLRKITGDDKSELTLEGAWQLLSDHVAAKEAEQLEAEAIKDV